LGRVVTVNYDAERSPTSVTQTWKDTNGAGSNTTHTWATLAYTTVTLDTDWSSSLTAVNGPPDGTVLKVLQSVTYADGSSTKFDYNPYGQVYKVSSVAADSASHVLNYTRVNIAAPSGTQSDCPRFGETASWAENFNPNSGGTPQEVVATNTFTTGASYSLPGSLSGTGLVKVETAVTGHPDGLYTRSYYGATGWNEGLPVATEDCTGTNCADRKRWTWTDWTQDNTGVPYTLNPRVRETRVGDATNTKKTEIDYRIASGNIAEFGLVSEVRVYGAPNLSTPVKQIRTDYNLASSYTSRRIIGLPSKVEAWGWNDLNNAIEYVSKVTYAYDEGSFSDSGLAQNVSPTQHDNANFGSSFVAGRGNMTSTTRWDARPFNSEAEVRFNVCNFTHHFAFSSAVQYRKFENSS
jgi:hypothetical protein